MNIIYKLTNLNRTDGMRFYIGSKTECKFLEVNGIPTIYNMKTNQPYFGSSSNFQFKQDLEEECNSYQPPFANKYSHKTLEILSKNISTFTKAAKLAGIEENELDNYSKLLIELSAGGVELSWIFHPNL